MAKSTKIQKESGLKYLNKEDSINLKPLKVQVEFNMLSSYEHKMMHTVKE